MQNIVLVGEFTLVMWVLFFHCALSVSSGLSVVAKVTVYRGLHPGAIVGLDWQVPTCSYVCNLPG